MDILGPVLLMGLGLGIYLVVRVGWIGRSKTLMFIGVALTLVGLLLLAVFLLFFNAPAWGKVQRKLLLSASVAVSREALRVKNLRSKRGPRSENQKHQT